LEAVKTNTSLMTGVHGAADCELHILQRMWSCWRPHVRSGRCNTDTSVSLEISRNTGIHRSSVGRIIHDIFKPPTQRKTTCLLRLL